MMADKEITCEPERTLPTISFCLIPFDIGILMTFQRNSNSYRCPSRTDLVCLDMMRIPSVIFGRSSSHIFVETRKELIRMSEECKLLNILISYFLAGITATISSKVPSPGNGCHPVLFFEYLSLQISSFDMMFESTSYFLNCHRWTF